METAQTKNNKQQFLDLITENPKHEKLMKVMDFLNISKMDPVVALASNDLKKREKMLREKLSKCYTTKWDDLIEIN